MTSLLFLAALATAAEPAGYPAQIAAPTSDGPGKEVAVVVDHAAVKIVAITLRAGTKLEDHAAPVPVTLEAVHGTATVIVAGVSMPIGAGALVVLDAGKLHAVVPTGTAPVTVLVHHHKGGAK